MNTFNFTLNTHSPRISRRIAMPVMNRWHVVITLKHAIPLINTAAGRLNE